MDSNTTLEANRISSLPPSFYYIPNFITPDEETAILDSINSLPQSRWTSLSHRRLLSLPYPLTGTQRDTLLLPPSHTSSNTNSSSSNSNKSPLPSYLTSTPAPVLDRFANLGIFKDSPHGAPNHCLVNEYKSGEGIMPHEDGPAYYGVTATVSLGSHTVLDLYRKYDADRDVEQGAKDENGEDEENNRAQNNSGRRGVWMRILQERRSLLVTMNDAYRDTLHGIAEVLVDEDLVDDGSGYGQTEGAKDGTIGIANWNMLGDHGEFAEGRKERQVRVSLTYRDVKKVSRIGGALRFMGKK